MDDTVLQTMEADGLIRIEHKGGKIEYNMNTDYISIISKITEPNSKSGKQVSEQVSEQVKMLILAMHTESSSVMLMKELQLNSRQYFVQKYLNPAIHAGLVELTQPDSPKSPKQKYRLTKTGIVLQRLLL